MSSFEVPTPILNSAFEEPKAYWYIRQDHEPEQRPGRRPSIVYPPKEGTHEWDLGGVLSPSKDFDPGYEMKLVNLVRERVKAWRQAGYPGVTRTTLELLQWWRRDGREHRLFFAQLEAAETIIFLNEARADFRQGVVVPVDEPSDQQKAEGAKAFRRYASKMATGSGKTTVMAMLAAWSILNKVNGRSDARFSDIVLAVCPNVTIRNRLAELDLAHGEASLYRTRDLVPAHLMPSLSQGRVLVYNWHVFEPQAVQAGGVSARVVKAGVQEQTVQKIKIGEKTTTARGSRYMTEADLRQKQAIGVLEVVDEKRDAQARPTEVTVRDYRYVESDTKWIERVIAQEVGGKQNLLVFNDEAHHAYRIRRDDDEDAEENLGEEEEVEEFFREATVWIDGLDRINRLRGINFCVDLSATPYYLGRVGQDTNKPFPWVVSDFSLTDAIESGLVKIPQLAVREYHVHAVPGKAQYRIEFPRVESYTQAVRNRVTVNWDAEAAVDLDPIDIPPEVEMKGAVHRADGRPTLSGPGKLVSVDLNPYRQGRRFQELVFDLARALGKSYLASGQCDIPPHVLFPQLVKIVERYLKTKVIVRPPAELIDVFCSPYYGWVVERLSEAIRPDTSQGEAPEVPKYEQNRPPGTTEEVSFWTSRDVREVVRSHLNYAVADTRVWEQSATYFIDTHPATEAFVKNAGLGFAIPYLHNGEPHDYVPDFIVRLKSDGEAKRHLILETKGYDELEEVKRGAAERWVNAVNADGPYGQWRYGVARRPEEVRRVLDNPVRDVATQ